jgi:hypothetical protein
MVWLLLVEVICVGGLFLVQVAGLVSWGGRLLAVRPLQSVTPAEQLDQTLRHFYRHEWWRFSLSVGYHLLGWLLGVIETLLILYVLQIPASLTAAIVIEALARPSLRDVLRARKPRRAGRRERGLPRSASGQARGSGSASCGAAGRSSGS